MTNRNREKNISRETRDVQSPKRQERATVSKPRNKSNPDPKENNPAEKTDDDRSRRLRKLEERLGKRLHPVKKKACKKL